MASIPDPLEFSARTRRDNLDRLGREVWDMVVIGGGITGAGVVRDAALRGLSAALVEREDFASGTSSRTGRMVHGGLRYLETGQVRMVAESLAERAVLRRTAPHLVAPHEFLMPLRGTPALLPKMAVGMALYQGLAFGRAVGPARLASRRRTLALEPLVGAHRLVGGVLYWDCLVDDARLVLAVIQDAHRHGAAVVNHAPAVDVLRAGGRVAGIACRDALVGRTYEIRARVVVNATGPWLDLQPWANGPRLPRLHRTKGIHIVVPRERLRTERAIIFRSVRDRRNLYLVPWGSWAIVGTTETDYDGDPASAHATADDVAYLLEAVRATFPAAALEDRDILSTFAGVRPLVDRPGLVAYRVPRDFQVVESQPGLIAVAGGKLTIFRRMAQAAVDLAQRVAGGPSGIKAGRPCRTAITGIEAGMGVATADQPRPGESGDLAARVACAVRHEMAMTLCDSLIRRLHLIHEAPDQGLAAAPEAARVMALLLGWSEAEVQGEIERYRQAVAMTRRYRM